MQDPYFSDQSVEKEKGIIGQEINMYNDQPDWQAFMGTLRALYKNNPVRIDIAGTVDSIGKITKDDLYTCYNTFYHPENMRLFVAGNIDAEKVMSLIKRNQDAKEFAQMSHIERSYPQEPDEAAIPLNKIKMPVSTPKCTVGIKVKPSKVPETFIKQDILQDFIMSYYFSKGGPDLPAVV
ncbi:pitrilysin family protein [Virgibacillus halophilus]|uniref:Pitrilysin family protein n=1 Tax=Tigheibacillus halophilus TaxID=361280 RepID=A0ABU5CAT4_9BACI|nr:pitrilysin family protein [Virgibacillus halophilus]